MNRQIYDMMMRRDMRMMDRGRRDMGYSMPDSRNYPMPINRGYDANYGSSQIPFEMYGRVNMEDFARRRNSRGQYMADGNYPSQMQMPYMMDYGYGYDYASSGYGKMKDDELLEWHTKLLKDVPEQYKHLFSKDNIQNVAKQMNLEFDKFTPLELTVTALMLATDYEKSVGFADVNRLVAMAKEWLCDEDVAVRYGEKLAKYYDEIVMG